MRTDNPYHSPMLSSDGSASRKRRAAFTPVRIGFLIGASPPAIFGLYHFVQFEIYLASLPAGTAACGNPFFESIALIVFVAPVLGLIGAGIAKVIT